MANSVSSNPVPSACFPAIEPNADAASSSRFAVLLDMSKRAPDHGGGETLVHKRNRQQQRQSGSASCHDDVASMCQPLSDMNCNKKLSLLFPSFSQQPRALSSWEKVTLKDSFPPTIYFWPSQNGLRRGSSLGTK